MKTKSEQINGYSLIELVVTLSIFSIMATIAVPYSADWRKSRRVSNVATVITYDLMDAKSKSITNNSDVIVTFDLVEQTYRMYLDTNGLGIDISNLIKAVTINSIDPTIQFGFSPSNGLDGSQISQAAVLGSTSSPIRCIFKPNGTAIHAGSLYLIPVAEAGTNSTRMHAIKIEKSGRISRWKHDGSQGLIPWKEHLS
jgi:prepilin-type N-terminal cleavage/methylation domain-containing protein